MIEASMERPRPLPKAAPVGQDARDLFYDTITQHPGHAVTPAAIVNAFRAAEMGSPQLQCDLFDDLIEPDCHLGSLFEKRAEAVAGKPWVVQAGAGDDIAKLAAHVMRVQLGKMPMVEVFQHLLSFNKYGWAAVEIDWDLVTIDDRDWIVPTWFTSVRARRFRIAVTKFLDKSTAVDVLKLYADPSRPLGDPLRPGKWIVIRRDAALPLAQSALMRSCAWPAMGKRYGFRDWVIYSEKYGKPLPLASYDEDADDQAKNVAAEIIANIGNDSGAIKPKTIDVEFKEVKGGDNSKTHGGLIAHCNAEMSKRVNGSTLANDNANSGGAGSASYGLGAVHDSVRWEAVQYDATRVETAFNTQLFAAFCQFNGLVCAPPEMKIQVVRDLTPATRVNVAQIYRNELGGKLSRAQMAQELGFREPTDAGDDLPGVPTPPPIAQQPPSDGGKGEPAS